MLIWLLAYTTGPVCYKKGGPLAVTDANLLLGRLMPKYFPHIFGPTEDQPLDIDATRKAFQDIAKTVRLISNIVWRWAWQKNTYIHIYQNVQICAVLHLFYKSQWIDIFFIILECISFNFIVMLFKYTGISFLNSYTWRNKLHVLWNDASLRSFLYTPFHIFYFIRFF